MRQVLEGGPVHAHTMYSTSSIRVVAAQHTSFMANEHTHRITHVLTAVATEQSATSATGGGKRAGTERLLAAEANEATT